MSDETRNDLNQSLDDERLDGERDLPQVAGASKASGPLQFLGTIAIASIAIVGLLAVNGVFSGEGEEKEPTKQERMKRVESTLPPLSAPPKPQDLKPVPKRKPAKPKVINTAHLVPPKPTRNPGRKTLTPEQRKMLAPITAYEGQRGQAGAVGLSKIAKGALPGAYPPGSIDIAGMGGIGGMAGMDPMGALTGSVGDTLQSNLKPTEIEGSRASIIKDRDFLITKGAFLDCALETAISSDVSGMVSARLSRDVYGTNGTVLLLERGTKLVGEYQSGMEQGKARIFVLWTRAETPNGVIVNLDSPGSDPLGRMGHSGYIDTHFWERFGGAIMLSVIDDVGNYLVAKASEDEDTNINFSGSSETLQEAGAIALEHSIKIPPTLLKNQGEHINVFVARDLDFRDVYSLEEM